MALTACSAGPDTLAKADSAAQPPANADGLLPPGPPLNDDPAGFESNVPKGRAAPTRAEVERGVGHRIDVERLRAEADKQEPVDQPPGTITLGELPGPQFTFFGYGDVENHHTGQALYGPDDYVVRIVKRVGTGKDRVFHVCTFDARTGEFRFIQAHNGGASNDEFSDLAETPWRD